MYIFIFFNDIGCNGSFDYSLSRFIVDVNKLIVLYCVIWGIWMKGFKFYYIKYISLIFNLLFVYFNVFVLNGYCINLEWMLYVV